MNGWGTGPAYRLERHRERRRWLYARGVVLPAKASPQEVLDALAAYQEGEAVAARDKAIARYEREGAPPADEARWVKDADKEFRRLAAPRCGYPRESCPGEDAWSHSPACRQWTRRHGGARPTG